MIKNLQFANLEIKIQEESDSVTYTFKGDVDENFLQAEVPRIKRDNIIFELAGIRNFNSCGIREWIYFIKDIGAYGKMTFRACSVAVIDQINLVPDSIGAGEIESFYGPYYCECQGEVSRLINVKDHAKYLEKKIAPPIACEKCQKPLEFDALEESYFLFTTDTLKSTG